MEDAAFGAEARQREVDRHHRLLEDVLDVRVGSEDPAHYPKHPGPEGDEERPLGLCISVRGLRGKAPQRVHLISGAHLGR